MRTTLALLALALVACADDGAVLSSDASTTQVLADGAVVETSSGLSPSLRAPDPCVELPEGTTDWLLKPTSPEVAGKNPWACAPRWVVACTHITTTDGCEFAACRDQAACWNVMSAQFNPDNDGDPCHCRSYGPNDQCAAMPDPERTEAQSWWRYGCSD